MEAPQGFDPVAAGFDWPRRGAHLIKGRLPPNWKTSRDPTNFQTVDVLLADERDPAVNPLRMGEGLEQVLDITCTCKAGLRTAASCCHRMSFLALLCATDCIDSAKVQEPLCVDTAR